MAHTWGSRSFLSGVTSDLREVWVLGRHTDTAPGSALLRHVGYGQTDSQRGHLPSLKLTQTTYGPLTPIILGIAPQSAHKLMPSWGQLARNRSKAGMEVERFGWAGQGPQTSTSPLPRPVLSWCPSMSLMKGCGK